MPLLELVIIGGAVFALVHAVRRLRAGDPINLALWFASLVYLFVTEPPLYFPEWFGLDEQYGFIFAHNLFTVQFMWDRLPLYIVAFYPAISRSPTSSCGRSGSSATAARWSDRWPSRSSARCSTRSSTSSARS